MPLFHTNGPSTEREAIERHEALGLAECNRNIVKLLVRDFPDETSAELNRRTTFLDVHEVRRRLTDLLNRGEGVQGDKRKCSVAGTLAVTWRIVE